MPILKIILPIFSVIFLGYFLKRIRFFDESFVRVLTQLVYQIVLPVLVFWEIGRSPFEESFNGALVAVVFIAMGFLFGFIMIGGRFLGFTPAQRGSGFFRLHRYADHLGLHGYLALLDLVCRNIIAPTKDIRIFGFNPFRV